MICIGGDIASDASLTPCTCREGEAFCFKCTLVAGSCCDGRGALLSCGLFEFMARLWREYQVRRRRNLIYDIGRVDEGVVQMEWKVEKKCCRHPEQ